MTSIREITATLRKEAGAWEILNAEALGNFERRFDLDDPEVPDDPSVYAEDDHLSQLGYVQ